MSGAKKTQNGDLELTVKTSFFQIQNFFNFLLRGLKCIAQIIVDCNEHGVIVNYSLKTEEAAFVTEAKGLTITSH